MAVFHALYRQVRDALVTCVAKGETPSLPRRNRHEQNGHQRETERQIPTAGAFFMEKRRGNDACQEDGGGAG